MKAIISLLLFPTLFFAQTPQQDTLQFINLFSSDMEKGVACYRIPAIITATNGDLVAAIDERVPSCGDLRHSKDINIVIRRSADNGQTWSTIERVVDYPIGQSASDPSMIVDEMTNDIFMFFNYMDLENANGEYYLKMIKSSDHGKSWSAPIDITSQISKTAWKKDFKFITSGRGIQTESGKLLHTLVNIEKGIYVFGSDDHGASWYFIDTPIQPADESKIVELKDGTWMINSRVNGAGLRYIHTSNDNGKTWTSKADSTLIDPSCNASLITLQDTLLFSNLHSTKGRENLSVKISYDGGRTWSKEKIIYVGKAAYSSMTILKNGDIGLFFEKDGYQENAFVRISMNWLVKKE